jgi:CheY-like chemotaxis protein
MGNSKTGNYIRTIHMTSDRNEFKRLGGRKIMVVEDLELNQYLARHILESWGCRVVIAGNGFEAFQLFQQNEFDCILMDVQMPEMDGIEATKSIRSYENLQKASVPIIAFTANTPDGDTSYYKAAGMDDYLAKPFDEKELFKVIIRNLEPESSEARSEEDNPGQKLYPTSNGTEDQKLYDLSMVRSVSEGDGAFIKKMVALFIKTVPPNVQELSKALEEENWDQVRKMAHKLKSTIDSMGVIAIREDIRTVESNAKELKSLDQIPALVRKIETVIDQCIEQLQLEID